MEAALFRQPLPSSVLYAGRRHLASYFASRHICPIQTNQGQPNITAHLLVPAEVAGCAQRKWRPCSHDFSKSVSLMD